MRQTSVGVPLPDYVQYVPGSCPNAEKSTHGAWSFFVHHSVEDDELEEAIDAFREKSQGGLAGWCERQKLCWDFYQLTDRIKSGRLG